MVPLNEIFNTLPLLTEMELKDLKRRINVLLSLGGAANNLADEASDSSTDHTQETLVLRLIGTVLERINGTPIVHYPKNAPIRVALRERLPSLMKYFESPDIDEQNRLGFMELALWLLAMNVEQQPIPLTPMVLVQQLSRLPAVVDMHFPGYYRSGILNKIIHAYEGQR